MFTILGYVHMVGTYIQVRTHQVYTPTPPHVPRRRRDEVHDLYVTKSIFPVFMNFSRFHELFLFHAQAINKGK